MIMRNRLRQVRLQRGLSQTRLAILAGVAGAAISDVERGVRLPWPKLRRKLAEILEVKEEVLFPPDGDDEGC